jgi:hypothetical protein
MICPTCGAEPCANPNLCQTCREVDGIDVRYADAPPPAQGLNDYGLADDAQPHPAAGSTREQAERKQHHKQAPKAERKHNGPGEANPFPLRVSDWLKRTDLVEPDFLLGHIFSTTTRALMWAATGLGKTMLGLSIAWTMAAGLEILGWRAKRKARVLYIDGEMSRRLLLDRLKAECERAGVNPDDLDLFVLSHEDIPDFKPLNTPAGQKQIEAIIKRVGVVDFVIFDNITSLTVGDLREGKSWSDTLPWVKSLTKRLTGQLWIHHTGHDETKSYGDKSKEWQLDLVLGLTEVKREDTDVSFKLEFDKARERTPANRTEFEAKTIALLNDRWMYSAAGQPAEEISPLALKFYETLCSVIASGSKANNMFGHPAASLMDWQTECLAKGLLDRQDGKNTLDHTSRCIHPV